MASQGVDRPPLAKHDSSILDLAFAMDCTGSMSSYIHTAQQNIKNIVEEIVAAEKSDIHLALVEYRDHPPQDTTFVTRTHDFTSSVKQMKGWLDACSAQGGGDTPEAVADALHDVLKLSWRQEATKICVLISDAPPHGLSNQVGDKFPNGGPSNLDIMKIVRDMAEKGITLYSVGCEPSINPFKDFFTALAYITGGQYVPLTGAKALTQVIIGGAQEEISLEKWMDEVNKEVVAEMQAKGTDEIDEEEIGLKVQHALRSKGVKTKHLQMNKAALAAPSHFAKKVSGFTSLSEVNSMYDKEAPPPPPVPGGSRGGHSFFGRKMKKSAKSERMSSDEDLMDDCFGAPSMAAPMPASEDVYAVEESEINMEQAKRMVQKSKMRHKSMFK